MTARSPLLYLSEMLASMEKIGRYTDGVTYDEFIEKEQLIDAVERNIEKIGEAAAGVPEEIRQKYPNVPWKTIVGLRNKVIHHYFAVDTEVIWQIATKISRRQRGRSQISLRIPVHNDSCLENSNNSRWWKGAAMRKPQRPCPAHQIPEGTPGSLCSARVFMHVTPGLHKYDNPLQETINQIFMTAGLRLAPVLLCLLLLACLVLPTGATSLGIEWKERPYTDNPFSGVEFSQDGTFVFATGDQMLLRSWDGSKKWGGRAGTVAALSGNGEFVATGIGQALVLLDKTMVDNWTRNMNGQVRAVAISRNATFVVSADSAGNYNTWAKNGEFLGRTTDDPVKQLALSPAENIIAATTEKGVRIFTPAFNPVWSDNKSGSIDTMVLISQDGKTVITAGGNRITSRTSTGSTNWAERPSNTGDIIDMACSYDCSAIILGTQDGTVLALDRYGTTRWTYKAGQWVNAVDITRDATLIVAGGLDGTVTLIDRSGDIITKKKMDSGIRARSVAISPDGKRIAVADQINLYGLSVLGEAEPGIMETFNPPPLDPVRTTATTLPITTVPQTTEPVIETPVPEPTTQQSPAGIVPVLGALAGAGIVLATRRR